MYVTQKWEGGGQDSQGNLIPARRAVSVRFDNFAAEPWRDIAEAKRLLKDLSRVKDLSEEEGFVPSIWRFSETLHECVIRSIETIQEAGEAVQEMYGGEINLDGASVPGDPITKSMLRFLFLPVDFARDSHLIAVASHGEKTMTTIYRMDWSRTSWDNNATIVGVTFKRRNQFG